MATVDMATGLNGGYAPTHWANVKTPYLVDVTIDYAAALTKKGSALAAADVIQAIDIPAGTAIISAGVECIAADDATTLTVTLSASSGGVFVSGWDHASAAAGDYAPAAAAGTFVQGVVGKTADTLDITLATLTGTLSVGKTRVWALLADVTPKTSAGIATPGS